MQDQVLEALKALGYGNVTTDVAQLTQGGTYIAQSLENVAYEMAQGESSFPWLDSVLSKAEKVGNELHEYIELTGRGVTRFGAVSNRDWAATEANTNSARKTVRVKYFATAGGTFDTIAKQGNNVVNTELLEQNAAIVRMKDSMAVSYWHGQGDGNVGGAAPDQIKGFSKWVDDGNWDGQHILDVRSNGYSGYDANGFSSPGDIELAQRQLGRVVFRPENGSASLSDLLVNASTAIDIDQYKADFQSYQILDANVQTKVKGIIMAGFANRFNSNQITRIRPDQYIDDGDKLKASVALNLPLLDATFTPASVAAVVAADGTGTSKWTAQFAGNYRYFTVAVNAAGIESNFATTGTGAPATVVAAVAGNMVTLTIAASSGGLETGYVVYRSHLGSINDIQRARRIGYVARTGASTTFIDRNFTVPGSVELYLGAFDDPQFQQAVYTLDYTQIALPRIMGAMAKNPFGVARSMGLFVGKPRHAAKIVGYVSKNGGYSPLTGPTL